MLPIQTILHPTDFSEHSSYAFRLACSLAKDYGARLVVLHVAVPPVGPYGEGVVISPFGPEELDQLRKQLGQIQPCDSGIRAKHILVEGEASEQILRTAVSVKSDVILMGTHGRTGLNRLLMGSVAEQAVRKSPCPVLTVKLPVAEKQTARQPTPKLAEATAS